MPNEINSQRLRPGYAFQIVPFLCRRDPCDGGRRWCPNFARAGDLKITIPRRSILTPVQRLNREGVDAVRKHNLKKAEELFYKAYLLDPTIPLR